MGRKLHGSGSRWSARWPGSVYDPADLGAVADQSATLAQWLLGRTGPGAAATEAIPALGDGSGPKRGLESSARQVAHEHYCGRYFSDEESNCALDCRAPERHAAQLSRWASRLLQWRKADGGLKEMAAGWPGA